MIKQKDYPIRSNKKIAEDYYKITLESNEHFSSSPTQFINVKVGEGYEHLLRKPFSVYHTNKTSFSFVFKVMGKGTQRLSTYKAGDVLNILGPLGTPFHLPKEPKTWAFIAGGVGIASLYALAQSSSVPFDLFYGVKNKHELAELDLWKTYAKNIFLSSDDGSCGEKGYINPLFLSKAQDYDALITCGPHPMLHNLHQQCPEHIQDYYVVEEYMACGFGICMGCVVKTTTGYRRICTEGPVFSGDTLAW